MRQDETIAQEAKAFVGDPALYFDYSYTKMHELTGADLEHLQLAALKLRFSQLYESVPMVRKLADKQGIERIDRLEDVVPLLFQHTMYKSYPPSLLENNRFDQLTRWLDKLTAHDLSQLDTSSCTGVTDWVKLLDEQTELRLNHSSGTSGVMSFNPFSREEYAIWGKNWTVCFLQKYGAPAPGEESYQPDDIYAVVPNYRYGAHGFIRANEILINNIAGSEERLYTLYPGRLDSDVLYLAARIRAAKHKGSLDSLKISPQLLARQKELEAQQLRAKQDSVEFFQRIAKELKGQRVFIVAVWSLLYEFARKGLEQGMSKVFSPDSVIVHGGGAKGQTPPADWEEVVCKFTGVPRLAEVYGMSEICASNMKCAHNHFHFQPTLISFLLDPDSSEVLPRTGTVTGRYAVYDLLPNSHWGGFISGDEVTINWDGGCLCGAKSAYANKDISRYSEKRGGDDKINCASTPEAHDEAMDFLTRFEM